jgi:hypothetical protein
MMGDDRKRRITRLARLVIVGVLVAAIANRLLARWAGGDTHLFDELLIVSCVLIPLAGLARIIRISRDR